MTEAEFFEFLNDSVAVATGSLMGFITVLFGYLLCAYFVGRKLTLIQLVSVTLAYSIFATINVVSIHYSMSRIGEIGAKYSQFYANSDTAELLSLVMPSLVGFVWFMSVVYMVSEYRKRHDAQEAA